VKDRKLVDKTGKQMSFTILLSDPTYERVALPYVQSLSRLGIDAHVRTVDPSQYQHLTDDFDFDMTMMVFPESDTPGNEQTDFWSCAAAKAQGSSNIVGICDPVVDALVQQVITAPDHDHLVPATRALDRVLLWGWYVVPNWHLPYFWVAYWNKFGHPDKPVRAGLVFNTWWIEPAKAAATDAAKAGK
jgi:microcin C transport system substrate-binding protein